MITKGNKEMMVTMSHRSCDISHTSTQSATSVFCMATIIGLSVQIISSTCITFLWYQFMFKLSSNSPNGFVGCFLFLVQSTFGLSKYGLYTTTLHLFSTSLLLFACVMPLKWSSLIMYADLSDIFPLGVKVPGNR